MDYSELIKDYTLTEINAINMIDLSEINHVVELLKKSISEQSVVYTFGNGGSAATALHLKNDFEIFNNVKASRCLRVNCLNGNDSLITAIANDISFDEIFRFQLENVINANDLVIAISGSGNSTNIINAVAYAKEKGAKIIGLTGFDGGKLKQMSDVSLHVPVNNARISEDIHLIILHIITTILACEYH